MKKFFTKTFATLTAAAVTLTLFAGVNVSTKAEDAVEVGLKPWSFYQAGCAFRNEEDPYAQRFYNSVTVGSELISGWGNPEAGTMELTQTSTTVADNFVADIKTTGWDGKWEGPTCVDNNPYLLRADMAGVPVKVGYMYTISFDAKWARSNDQAPEKNLSIGVANSDESVFANDPEAVTKIKIGNGQTVNYSQDFTVWSGDGTLSVTLSYGCFLYDFNNGLTTENTSAAGRLEISNFKIVERGKDPNYKEDDKPIVQTTEPSTTGKPQQPAGGDRVTTPGGNQVTPAVKLAKVIKVKAKNTKKKTIKVSWKKVTNAKKYQIKIGTKTYSSTKNSKVVKSSKFKKGKKIKVKVRAVNGSNKGTWSKTVKVKIKK